MMDVPSTVSPWRRLAAVAYPRLLAAAPIVWLLHGMLWGGLVFIAWQVNRETPLQRWLRSPWPALHEAWLPTLLFLLYGFGWLALGLWNALRSPAHAILDPDIETIWTGACRHLAQVRPDGVDLPLFLIVGPSAPESGALLEAVGAAAILPRTAASLHVFANADAIFLICGSALFAEAPGQTGTTVLRRAGMDKMASDHLRHICRLLTRDRPGQRALQGIVVAAPLELLADDERTSLLVSLCQAHLGVVRQETGLECPLFFAISGLAGSLPEAKDGWFRRFPLMHDCEPEESALVLRQGIDRFFSEEICPMALRRMRLDPGVSATGTMTEGLRDNIRCLQLRMTIHSWKARLERLITDGTRNDVGEPGLIAGCCFLPEQLSPESPVVKGLWFDLLTHRQDVAWTPESWTEAERQRRSTRRGYGLILAGWAGAAATVAVLAHRH